MNRYLRCNVAIYTFRHIDLPFPGGKQTVYVSNPTWGNHHTIFKDAGFDFKEYKYYNPKTCGLEYDGTVW
jgi:aspartate/tyrosine/aromatic aminotransferase